MTRLHFSKGSGAARSGGGLVAGGGKLITRIDRAKLLFFRGNLFFSVNYLAVAEFLYNFNVGFACAIRVDKSMMYNHNQKY